MLSTVKRIKIGSCIVSLLLMFYLINISVVSAQTSVVKATTPQANFTNFNTEQGLALSSISCGIIDKMGNLWFGTFGEGLIKYEQDNYERITNDNGFSIKLVKTIYKDREGKLWYAIGEGSVYGFDGESFYRFDGKPMGWQGLTDKLKKNTKSD